MGPKLYTSAKEANAKFPLAPAFWSGLLAIPSSKGLQGEEKIKSA